MPVACKGDWPFLRSAFGLQTGFTSKRICHYCPSTASWNHYLYFVYRAIPNPGKPETMKPVSILIKDWYDVGSGSSTWSWPKDPNPRSDPKPFKPNIASSPLRGLPFFSTVRASYIQADPAHTYAICGWGKDLMAGVLLVMIIDLHIFHPTGKLEPSFREAFARFRQWCRDNGRTTSMTEFSFKTLKIQSCPESKSTYVIKVC